MYQWIRCCDCVWWCCLSMTIIVNQQQEGYYSPLTREWNAQCHFSTHKKIDLQYVRRTHAVPYPTSGCIWLYDALQASKRHKHACLPVPSSNHRHRRFLCCTSYSTCVPTLFHIKWLYYSSWLLLDAAAHSNRNSIQQFQHQKRAYRAEISLDLNKHSLAQARRNYRHPRSIIKY